MEALSSPIYAIQIQNPDVQHLLAHPQLSFLPEDIHICGNCKQSFTNINEFFQHKKDCNNALLSTATFLESTVDLQLLQDQPLLQLVFDDRTQQFTLQSTEQNNCAGLNESQSKNDKTSTEAVVASSIPDGAAVAAALLEHCNDDDYNDDEDDDDDDVGDNDNDENGVHFLASKRNVHVDEKDVASLLANQFSKEDVNIESEKSLSNTCGNNNIYYTNHKNHNIQVIDRKIAESTVNNNENGSVTNVGYYSQQINSNDIDHNVKNDIKRTDNIKQINVDSGIDGRVQLIRESGTTVASSKPLQIAPSIEVISSMPEFANYSKKTNTSKKTVHLSAHTSPKKCVSCPHCQFATLYANDLTRHMRLHTGERPFKCPECDRHFNRKDKLRTHFRIHTGERPYQCQFCNYAAIDSGPLKKHLRTHTDERPFKCQFCSYGAKDTSQLTVHLRTHTGDAPFVCSVEKCGKAFKTSTDLKRHGLVHQKANILRCKECKYKTTIKSNLDAHYELRHFIVLADDGCGTFSCVVNGCDFNASSKAAVQSHIDKDHPDCKSSKDDIKNNKRNSSNKRRTVTLCKTNTKRPASQKKVNSMECNVSDIKSNNILQHTCNLCNHQARTQNSLRQHLKRHHPNISGNSASSVKLQSRASCQKSFQCTYCPAAFVRQDSWRSHIKQHQSISGEVNANQRYVKSKHFTNSSESNNNNNENNCYPTTTTTTTSTTVNDKNSIFMNVTGNETEFITF